jgi:hypothetical protein
MYFLFLSAGIERKSKSLTEFKSLDKRYYSRSHLSQQAVSYQRGKCCVFLLRYDLKLKVVYDITALF